MLAFKLLKKASITGDDKKLCLTGMDFSEKDKLYDQAKKSLKKYCTDGNFASASTSAETVKLEHGVKQEVFAVGGRAGFYDNASQRDRGTSGHRFWPSHRPFRTNSESRSWKTGSVRGRGISERPLNPIGNDGKLLRCKGCGSYRHFLDACPESWNMNMNRAANRVRFMKDHEYEEDSYFHSEDSDGEYYPNYVMITENDQLELTTFSVEAQNCAVLDTACGSTVCGQQWFSTYMDSVGRDQVSLVQPGGFSTFKFGAGPIIPSLGTYEIPIRMAGIRIQLRTDVVDCDIPLLLSKTAMKKAGVVINMNDDTAVIFGKSVPLNTTTSGHYCVPIHSEYSVEDVAEILAVQQIPAAEQVKTFLKLHRQFGHSAQHKLISLLKDAGTWKEEYKLNMDKVYEKCQQSGLCRFKDRITRPVVAMSLASDLNEKNCDGFEEMERKMDFTHCWFVVAVHSFSVYSLETSHGCDTCSDDWMVQYLRHTTGSVNRQWRRVRQRGDVRSWVHAEHWGLINSRRITISKWCMWAEPPSSWVNFDKIGSGLP